MTKLILALVYLKLRVTIVDYVVLIDTSKICLV